MLEQDQATSESTPRDLYRIGEVSRITQTKPFVLRYWESEFPMLQPVKTPKGHRLYRSEDIEMIRAIKRLLYDEGFTIAGARRHLTDHGPEVAVVHASGNGHGETASAVSENPHQQAGQGRNPGGMGGESALQIEAPRAERHVLRELRMELAAILTLLTGQ